MLVTLALQLPAAVAHATDAKTCIDESERAQHARAAGKLREAREHLLRCGDESCPAIVRRDCAKWQSEVTELLPGVVLGAKDPKGADLFDVNVTLDGEPLVTHLDGKAVAVDPGAHTFTFTVSGQPPVAERVLVKEGEKARALNVTFAAAPRAGEPAPSAPPRPGATGGEGHRGGHSVAPWILVGVGSTIAFTGVVMYLAAPALPSNCDAATSTCVIRLNESSADLANDQDRAGAHVFWHKVGLLTFAGGALVVGGGLLWHFLEPANEGSSSSSRVRVTPWTSASAAGVTLGGGF
jgi:hypothetical protein